MCLTKKMFSLATNSSAVHPAQKKKTEVCEVVHFVFYFNRDGVVFTNHIFRCVITNSIAVNASIFAIYMKRLYVKKKLLKSIQRKRVISEYCSLLR